MLRSVRWPLILLLTSVYLGSTPARADLAVNSQRGEDAVQIPVSGRAAEICIVPKHLSDANFSDKDLKAERELCDIDEHSNAAVCPKINSTNPGLDFFSVPQGSSPNQVSAAHCKAASSTSSNPAKHICFFIRQTLCSCHAGQRDSTSITQCHRRAAGTAGRAPRESEHREGEQQGGSKMIEKVARISYGPIRRMDRILHRKNMSQALAALIR